MFQQQQVIVLASSIVAQTAIDHLGLCIGAAFRLQPTSAQQTIEFIDNCVKSAVPFVDDWARHKCCGLSL
jgi:hypothetical protein